MLFGRALLIIILPIIFLEAIIGFAFIQRYFEQVTTQLAKSTVLQINYVLDRYEKIVSEKIHYDSEDEEARKLKKMLEDYDRKQDIQITRNRTKDIEQDEEIQQLINKVEQEGLDIRELINSIRKEEK